MSHSELNVHLNGYSFDPLNEGPIRATVSSATDAPEGPAHYIIQFTRVLTQEERARIQGQYGLRLTDYVPEFAYLEQLSPQQLASLSTDPLFRASTPYQPEFKISPGIGQVVFRSAARNAMPGLLLRAVLFPEADPASVVAALEGVGARATRVLDDRAQGGPAQIQFVLSSQAELPTIAGLEDVRWIEEVPEINLDNGNTAGTIQSGTPGDEPIWNQGLHGEGQIIGIIDGVVDMNHCWFRDAHDNTPGPAHRKVVGLRNIIGGAVHAHGTFVAGIVAGDDINNPAGDANRGNAWAARITSSNGDDLLITSLFAYLTAAAADGAFIHTNSWHLEPIVQYSQAAADVDAFVWNNEDHLVLGSSGNAGIGEVIGPPGTAKNALCVSATQRDPNEMSFGDGNNGPTSDGRRKPEIFAPGCSIVSARANTLCTVALDQVVFGFPVPTCVSSWATPAVAAAAALIRQYYTEGWYPTGTRQPGHGFTPSGALLKATLLNATIDMTGIAGYPGNQEGWGLLRLDRALFFPGSARTLRVWDTRNADGLNSGESRTHHVAVEHDAEALKITLVWSEPPGLSNAANPVINNLDLIVTSPDGTQTFLGNNFAGGVSATGGSADTLNNVEMVLINNPMPGDWTITVRATAVNVGNPGQGYALAITGALVEAPITTGVQDALAFQA